MNNIINLNDINIENNPRLHKYFKDLVRIAQARILIDLNNDINFDDISLNSDSIEDSDDEINYYQNANNVFKNRIGKNKEFQKMFNYFSDIIMDDYDDFTGRFNDYYYIECFKLIKDNFITYINKLDDRYVSFFIDIYKKIIYEQYEKVIKRKNNKANKLLKNLEKIKCKSKEKNKDKCVICFENLKNNLVVKTPCNHLVHRKCLKKWLLDNKTCPLCRKNI